MRRFWLILLLILPNRLIAQEIDYLRDIKPILREKCYACHGALKQKAKLRLDTVNLLKKGGRSGPAMKPALAEKSLVIEKVTANEEKERMPPEGKPLTDKQITLLKTWIQQGAKAPADEKPEEDPRQHWAFLNPVRPPVPQVKNQAWVKNPIDAFIATEHEKRGLIPASPAEKATLLRRVYIDLIGLPPTRTELQSFLADSSPDAYEKGVDQLMASPRYAERWARHWMDIWRYSDWYGSRHINELRNSRRHIWRWRDWIIDSLENDKGYDRMIQEMLAADELAPGDLDAQRASGYLGRSFYVFNRNVWLQDTVEYTGTCFLGITFKCCRCHDHKYDPIAQEDYYRLRAFFEPHQVRTDPLPGKRELLKSNVAMGSPPGSTLKEGLDCAYDADLKAVTYVFDRGNDKNPVKDREIKSGVPAILTKDEVKVTPVNLPLEAYYPELRPEMRAAAINDVMAGMKKIVGDLAIIRESPSNDPLALLQINLLEKQLAAHKGQLTFVTARLDAELAKVEAGNPNDPKLKDRAAVVAKLERMATLLQTEAEVAQAEFQLAKEMRAFKPKDDKAAKAMADAEKKLADLRAKLPAAQKAASEPAVSYTPLASNYPSTSTGRRLALARWITSKDNPLTARVAVNHIWLRHMGSALVPSVFNFGLNGKRPINPKLLDWLAVEFMENNWSMKHIHRLIVTSNTYCMSSEVGSRNSENRAGVTNSEFRLPNSIDPENRYLWRSNIRRMEAEVVRDSLLHLAGKLDVARGGEDLDPANDDKIPRRSLYFRHTPDEKPLMLEVFDGANATECFERTESIIPQQALALANSDFCHSHARLIARKWSQAGDDDFIAAAFEHLLTRPPSAEERIRCRSFLLRHEELLTRSKKLTAIPNAITGSGIPPSGDPKVRAHENLVHVLLNYNEFVTIR